MIKRFIIAFIFMGMIAVAVVQAVEKEQPAELINKEEISTSIPVDQILGVDIGQKAPDFELETLQGDKIKLSDLQGQKVMLNFWATWCPPCKAEMPDMQKFYEETKDEIQILAVNIDPEYDVAGFAKEMKIDFPILLDKEDKAMNSYRILTIPTSYFIDEQGIIQNKFMGAMSKNKMKEYLKNM